MVESETKVENTYSSDEGSECSFNWSEGGDGQQFINSSDEKNGNGLSFSEASGKIKKEVAVYTKSLLKNVHHSDLVIHCLGGKIPAHRLILSQSVFLAKLLQENGEIADIYLMEFNLDIVEKALTLVYAGNVDLKTEVLDCTKGLLESLGFYNLEIKRHKEVKPKKYLKVKHEKNLGSRKPPTETKIQAIRKKRVLMANLDQAELTCDECDKVFPALYKLRIHKLIHLKDCPFICAQCGKGFNNKYKMHSHEKKKMCDATASKPPKPAKKVSKPSKSYECQECDSSFTMVKDLKKHVQETHKVKEQLTCSHCNTVCRSQKTLITHLKVVHNDHDSGLKCTCGVCGKRFLKLSSLEDHIMRHNSIKHFSCMYCPKRCATKQDLDRHLRSHSGEANLVCQFCQRTFVHRKTYTNHVRKHMGQKPYHCRHCNKQFGALNYLKKHQNSHQKKGDNTRLVTAKKGSRSSYTVSYIDSVSGEGEQGGETGLVAATLPTATVYIPGPHYIQTGESITPLCQMQVISDYTEVSRLNYDTAVGDTDTELGGWTVTMETGPDRENDVLFGLFDTEESSKL